MNKFEVKVGLDRQQLKYIAVMTMIIDHIAMYFISVTNLLYMLCRVIGRITAPIMCYFLVEGFQYTSSKKKICYKAIYLCYYFTISICILLL
ncbi:putative membrane protein [Clostridium bornimense]|uniref:Putative membrane protein n=1 Tax=Clostridium bornimense TaxID=1216932 RepID=W6S0P7_9CLOT|nr:TraX family protein [Clostridium bornimense]CDM69404.1 putative membrane protein [Clostridium bornimense]